MMASRKERDREYLERELKSHKGKWLTEEIVVSFQKKTGELAGTEGQITGERKVLCQKLMNEYGVTELEAVNILGKCGGTKDYVNKYRRIREQIPLDIRKDRILEDVEDDHDWYE